MEFAQSGCPTPDRQQLSSILSDQSTRRLLACLQTGPATIRDLAVALSAAELDCDRSSIAAEQRRRSRRTIRHSHLPRLADAGLVERSPDGIIRYRDTPLDRYDVAFPDISDPTHPSWPAAAAVLGRAYRYPLLSLLTAAEDSVSLSWLTSRLVDADSTVLAESDLSPRKLRVSLHHTDLPKLAAVDLLSYDARAKTATPTPVTETVL